MDVVTKAGRALVLVFASALVMLWVSSFWMRRETKAHAALAGMVRPYPIVGVRLNLNPHDFETVDVQDEAGPRKDQRLVLLLSDSCEACRIQVDQWQEMIAGIPPGGVHDVTIVSFDGLDMAKTLERALHRQRISYRTLITKDPAVFSARTGLQSTPQTILIDGSSTVRAIRGGVLPTTTLSVLANVVRAG
jgi:hypothetical protein